MNFFIINLDVSFRMRLSQTSFYLFIYLFIYLFLSILFTAKGAENGLEFAIVRPFNWIGPRMDIIPGIDGPSQGVPRVLACFSNVSFSIGHNIACLVEFFVSFFSDFAPCPTCRTSFVVSHLSLSMVVNFKEPLFT